ncbi:MAG: F0F1 ATP synthase subunit delta [Dehalococcoidia bacterium]
MARAPKAKRYAQALFTLAQEKGTEAAWLDDLLDAERLFADPDVDLFMSSPRLPADRKLQATRELLSGKGVMVVNMIGLLITRQAADLLLDIATEYRRLLDESLGRVYAMVTSAAPVSKDQQELLQRSLSQALDKEIVLELQEDAAIIGGLMVRVGDQIIDGTVRSRLESLRMQLAHETLTG